MWLIKVHTSQEAPTSTSGSSSHGEQLIISLFFTLAYNYRSVPKKIVSKEYFNMWRNKLNKIDIKNFSNDFMYNFMEEVTSPNSNIPHFISNNFIKWLWKSLFIEFDETLLNEFFVFDSRKERFSLEYYFIFRVLVSSEILNLEKKLIILIILKKLSLLVTLKI